MDTENTTGVATQPEAEQNPSNPFWNMTDVGQAEDVLNLFRRDYPDKSEKAEKMLQKMLEALLRPDKRLTGSADDFHNFSVTISKMINDNQASTDIVRAGLLIHPTNTDLLADALKYGYDSGAHEDCVKWYNKLMTIDKRFWTWRAFSFAIDYLLDSYDANQGSDVSVEDIVSLAKDYQKYKPDEEDAWLSEQEIYERTNQREEAIKTLEEAISKFKSCPKCWLRYADIMIDRGDYEMAAPLVRKLIRTTKSSESVNRSYVYYLDGLCKMDKMVNAPGYDDGEIDETSVLRVYKAFQLALNMSGLRENVKSRIDELIKQISLETEVKYPY